MPREFSLQILNIGGDTKSQPKTDQNNRMKPIPHKKFISTSLRSRKVHWTVVQIAFRSIWLFWRGHIFGKKYVQKRLTKLHISSAIQLKNTFLELQGLFIKIGQLVSILSSFLPEEFRKPLEEFQDHAPARPFSEIEKTIESELRKPIRKLFNNFDKVPLASASIGQVHRATLFSGEEVVVKIQHSHISEIADIDLELFEKVMKMVSGYFKMKGLEHVASQVRQMIREELDYGKEAENMAQIGENLSSFNGVIIPQTYSEFCTSKIIVSDFHKGVKINNLAQLDKWKIDKKELAERFLKTCCQMVLKDGIYHADPHPGNIIIKESGEMVLLDFGAVSEINQRTKKGLSDLISAVTKADSDEIIEAMQYMGFIVKDSDSTEFSEKVLEFVQDFLQNEVQMDSLNFKDIQVNFDASTLVRIFDIISIKDLTNSFQVPKDYILLNRMIILAGGISAELAPNLNPLEVVKPYITGFVIPDLKDLPKFILDFGKKNLANVITLPLELQKVLLKIKRGEVVVRPKNSKEKSNLFYFLGQQIIMVLLCSASGFLAYFAHTDGFQQLFQMSVASGAIFAVLWLRAIFIAQKYRRQL